MSEYAAAVVRKRERLLADLLEECQRDPQFLDRVLKELKPMRPRGRAKRPSWHYSLVDALVQASSGIPPGQILAAIEEQLSLSPGQARRLYDEARKRVR